MSAKKRGKLLRQEQRTLWSGEQRKRQQRKPGFYKTPQNPFKIEIWQQIICVAMKLVSAETAVREVVLSLKKLELEPPFCPVWTAKLEFSSTVGLWNALLKCTVLKSPLQSFTTENLHDWSPSSCLHSCFLSLLLVAAVVWKIKQSCWASRRREVSLPIFSMPDEVRVFLCFCPVLDLWGFLNGSLTVLRGHQGKDELQSVRSQFHCFSAFAVLSLAKQCFNHNEWRWRLHLMHQHY